MGKPAGGGPPASARESIARGGEPGELKHLSSRRKRKKKFSGKKTSIPEVAASEPGGAQTAARAPRGLGLPHVCAAPSGTCLGRQAGEGESPVGVRRCAHGRIRSTTGHEEPCGKTRGPPRKAEYYPATDRAEYCEGKVKRTPGGE